MKIPFFSFNKINTELRDKSIELFEQFYDSQWYVLGKFTEKFEQKYAKFNQVSNCVGVSSGLDALHLALKSLDIGPGDEVIVPSNTYIATVLAVSYTGAKPVFVEPRIETCNINPDLIEQAITTKTKCIMPVHLYGQACEMDQIMAIANDNGLFVVEDNAQAHGAKYNSKLTGSFGAINATSFYPTKNLGALGEAGAITTDNFELAQKVRMLRNYGSKERYYNEVLGYNNRIDEFEAAYLAMNLDYLEEWTSDRTEIANYYREELINLKNIELIDIADGATTVNHLFVIRINQRDELKDYLSAKGIGTQIHYPIPPHLQKAYKFQGHVNGDFPIAEKIADTVLSLPIWPGMESLEVKYIIQTLKRYY